ncbi:hypothetical protein [Mesorhizobium sp. LNHC252B00]|uniref:hypothetical protein n=1 Tax=Mesorhizobium sp. LNHC252B00 TaxID=1287252 RepID=UPI001FD9D316|nr:hypothetical protein [Mesorhizobium sp. LNHC252B00]
MDVILSADEVQSSRPLHLHLETVNTSGRSDKEQVVIFATKGHICRRLGHIDLFDPLSHFIEYSHTNLG